MGRAIAGRWAQRAAVAAVVMLVPTVVDVAGSGVPTVQAAGAFEPLAAPQRLLDTRPGESTADGQYAGIGILAQGSTLELQVGGRVGVAANAASVVLNVTVDGAQQDGFLTVHPCDVTRPNASNLNFRVGQTIPNTVVTKLGPGGTVCVFSSGVTHAIVDVSGVLASTAFKPLPAPLRLLDTRPGESTTDAAFAGIGMRQDGDVVELAVAGRAGIAANASAVVLNVTVDGAQRDGFVTVYPCDATRPNASNLNFVTGSTIPNAVFTKLAPNGTVCLFTSGATHLIVDVAGELSPGSFLPLDAPKRVLDTRDPNATADGLFSGGGLQTASSTLQLKIGGRVGVPANASAVVLNVTVVSAQASGFVTAHPRGTGRPNASNLNFIPAQVVPNAVIAGIGPNGEVCLFTSGATHLIVDVAGWLTGPAPAATGANCPSTVPVQSDAETTAALLTHSVMQRTVGNDLIAVWVCDVPADSTSPAYMFDNERNVIDENELVAWAQANVAPYFAEASRGRFTTTFVALGRIQLTSSEGPWDCESKALAATNAPYTNLMFTDTGTYGGGQGGPGLLYTDPRYDRSVLDSGPPRTSRRGFWVGGGVTGGNRRNPSVVVHEIGHTIHWPHSYTGLADEYDNRLDVMSGEPDEGWCEAPFPGGGTISWPCFSQHTLAFNRFAAGWIDGNQVAIHRSGTTNYTLDAPTRAGVQMVALPDPADGRGMLTLEARPAVGRDQYLEAEGVAVHVIDQAPRGGDPFGINGFSTGRHQRQAIGAPESYDHVVRVGQSLTVHGVTVTVLSRIGDTFEVSVSGTFHTPAGSFFGESRIGRSASCATLDLRAAFERGCIR